MNLPFDLNLPQNITLNISNLTIENLNISMPITDNNGSSFYNLNSCRSFNQTILSSLTPLSSFGGSEITIVNRTGTGIWILDNNNFSINNSFLLLDTESMTFRGITNSNMMSAMTLSGNGGRIDCRVSRFSNYNQG